MSEEREPYLVNHSAPDIAELIKRCQKILGIFKDVDKISIVITVKQGEDLVDIELFGEDRTVFTRPIVRLKYFGGEG